MTKFNAVSRGCGLLLLAIFALGDAVAFECKAPAIPNLTLESADCDLPSGLNKFVFMGDPPSSPYATDFDRRQVVVARADTFDAVQQAAGIKGSGGTMGLLKTSLVPIPANDQILSRKVTKRPGKQGDWIFFTERVQYAAQGGMGFVLECATALRQRAANFSAVAECYPLEERTRFLKLLFLEI